MDFPCERDLGRYCVASLDEIRRPSGNKIAKDGFQCFSILCCMTRLHSRSGATRPPGHWLKAAHVSVDIIHGDVALTMRGNRPPWHGGLNCVVIAYTSRCFASKADAFQHNNCMLHQ